MIKKHLLLAVSISVLVILTACSNDEYKLTKSEIIEIKTQLAELTAREEIRILFTDYGRSLDERDYEKFATLYAEDASYISGSLSQGPDAIAHHLESVISANATGANLHIFTNDKIEVDIQNNTATAISRGAFYIEDRNGNPAPLMFATYLDQLILTSGGWKFQRREVVADLPGPANENR